MSRKLLAALPALAVLCGCLATPESLLQVPTSEWSAKITRSRDEFRKHIQIKGAEINSAEAIAFLRWTSPDAAPMAESVVLYVMGRMNDWHFLDTAHDSTGTRLRTSVLDRQVLGCTAYSCMLREHVLVHLDRKYLRDRGSDGISIRLDGKRGSMHIYLPPSYVATFHANLPEIGPIKLGN